MVYTVYYKHKADNGFSKMFDIEVFQTRVSENETLNNIDRYCFCEIHSLPIVSESVDFIHNQLDHSKETEFRTDCKELEELRSWLYEVYGNELCTVKENNKRFDKVNKYVKDKVFKFADKWNLLVDVD